MTQYHPFHQHAFSDVNPLVREGLVFGSRRNMIKASMAGLAGLTLPNLLYQRAQAAETSSNKSVILLWITGGPSHIEVYRV